MITNDRIRELELEIIKHPQVEIEPRHYFGDGFYVREILIPSGTFLTGKTHATNHVSVMLSGEMTILTPEGGKRIEAPFMHIGKPGTKRLGYAIKDSLWITIHSTSSRDLAQIEREEFEEGDASVFDFSTGKVTDGYRISHSREDYLQVLQEHGIPHELAREQTENEDDQVAINLAEYGLELKPSTIDGTGVFSLRSFVKDDVIGPGRVSGMRTQLGRYMNHSCYPNATVEMDEAGNIYMVAIADIGMNEEITVDYRESLSLAYQISDKEKSLCQG